jgi:thioredoxin-like negative regulator of GroEL
MKPHYIKVARRYADRILFAELNVDRYRDIAKSYNLEGIPTTILFKDGKELDRITMNLNTKQLEFWAKEALKEKYDSE